VETQTGIIKGKLRYMPPEQIAGDKIDRRADIYAVGVMLWEAVTGDRMWKGEAEPTIMKKVLNGEIPSPRTVKPDLDPRLETMCMKALSPDRSGRFSTAAELEAELETICAELNLRASNREIGKCVTGLFEDVRAKTKTLVETQLSKVATLSWSEYQASEFSQLPTMTFSHQTASSSVSNSDNPTRHQSRAPSKRMPFLVSAAVVLVLGLVFLMRRPAPPPEAAGAPPPQAAVPQAPAPAAPTPATEEARAKQVAVHMTAYPASAKLYYDDEAVPSNPATRLVSADGTKHVVRAEANGFNAERYEVVLDKDSDVVLMLKRESSKGKPHSSPPSAPAAAPPPVAAPPPAGRPNCDPPYFVDQRGIKKFKPECM
jgi:serine/threonine-protein kinase